MFQRAILTALALGGLAAAAACSSGEDGAGPAVAGTAAAETTTTAAGTPGATAVALSTAAPGTPAATSSTPASAPTVAAMPTPDPDEAQASRTAAFIAREYPLNNLEVRTVELHEIFPVLPRDGIPAIFRPFFDTVAEGDAWLEGDEPVVVLRWAGEARAYPLQILTWHEIVNDVVGGEPLIVTYCPLCNTAIAFRSTVDGRPREFGVSGALRRNDLIMYDRETETLWQQITGEAIVGEAAGTELEFVPVQISSWSDFRDTFPEGQVLNRNTGTTRSYGENPYRYYDQPGSRILFEMDFVDGQLDAKERVLTVDLGDDPVAFPFSQLTEHVVLEANSGGQRVVAFWQSGTTSALDETFIIAGRNIGSAAAFLPVAGTRQLSFETVGGAIQDVETRSTWNVLGKAVAGPLEGTQLEAVVSANHFWFAWAAFEPETRIVIPSR